MSHYEITVSVTALCSCCGKELPSSSYLTESRGSNSPFERDDPYERKDRRVFITPCAECFAPRSEIAELSQQRDVIADLLATFIEPFKNLEVVAGQSIAKSRSALARIGGAA